MPIRRYPPLHTPTGSSPAPVPVVQLDWGNAQVQSLGSGSVGFSIYSPLEDTIFEMCSSVAAWYTVGKAPTAAIGAVGSHLLPANTVRYVYVAGAQNVAAISTSSGPMSIVPALVIG